MAEKQYFIKRDGDIRGPFDSDEVKRLVSEQKILPLDEFSISARGPWKAAHRIPGIGLTGERDSQDSKPSFMKSRYFTIALGIASLVGTGLVGGLFEYIGSRIAANAAADADPFQNPQPDVFSEWMNRKEFMKLRATFENKRKGLTFWDLGYWIEDIEGKLVGGENKFRCKYSDNLDGLKKDQWHWQFELSENRFQKLNDQYTSQGFDLFKHHFFEDNQGRNHHQAIWRIDPLSALSKFEPKQTNSITPEQPEKKVEYSGRSQFATADLNSDGVITISEFPQLNQKKVVFKEHDRNDDGSLDFPEWFVFHIIDFNSVDHDKDGFVSYEEYVQEHDRLDPKVQAEGKAWFKNADDGDGKLSKDEFTANSGRPGGSLFKELLLSQYKSTSSDTGADQQFKIPKNISAIQFLTAEQAAEVVDHVENERKQKELFLTSLLTVDKQVAHELAKFQGNKLDLSGPTTIDVNVAQELAKFQGKLLFLNGLTILDYDVARELVKGDYDLYLDGLTKIDRDLARTLAMVRYPRLSLLGLTTIDENVAQELANFKGHHLILGLKTMDIKVAKALAPLQSNLWIWCLASMNARVAHELSAIQSHEIVLNGLRKIDKETAEGLGDFLVDNLYLWGLKTIDKDVAHGLAKFQGEKLDLRGLTTIDAGVAQELAKFQGEELKLLGLESIDAKTQAALKVNPKIKLPNIQPQNDSLGSTPTTNKVTGNQQFRVQNKSIVKSLTTEQAAEFVTETGHTGQKQELNLDSLTEINQGVARELAKFQGEFLLLNGLTSIDEKVAAELAKVQGQLHLNGLISINEKVAMELAKKIKDRIRLDGLTSISKDVAKNLAKIQAASLGLNGLTSIDKIIARELAKTKAAIGLNGLTSIDNDVAKEFLEHKGFIWLLELKSIDQETLQTLKTSRKIKLPAKYK